MWFMIEDLLKVAYDVIGPCTAPLIDSLVIIPDRHDIRFVAHKQLKQTLLSIIDILVLINNQVLYWATPTLSGICIGLKEINCHGYEVIKRQC